MVAPILLAFCALLPTALSAPAASGTFNILSFNVAGLPTIFNGNDIPGDKETNTALIGTLFSQYNYSLINVQEDFNYHAALYAGDDHPQRTATSGGVPFGSGLNTLSVFYWVDFERIKWGTCSDASGADCLTPKGFTFMRVQVSEGVWIDAYNLHADAGTESNDLTARAANLRQVSEYITAHSAGNAVLVFGDTNTRYTRTADIPSIFINDNGMKDAWIELAQKGVIPTAEKTCQNPSNTTDCEIVDKAWYRGSPALTLKATSFQYAGSKFLQPDGNILSDHDPILVDFQWTLGTKLRTSDFMGGPHGDYYNDLTSLATISAPKASSITLRGAERVDGVAVTLASGQTFTHGGTGGTASTLTLAQGEHFTGATMCQGKNNDHTTVVYMEVSTSSGKKISTGQKSSDCATRTAETGWGIVGFTGRADDEMDRIALIYGKV